MNDPRRIAKRSIGKFRADTSAREQRIARFIEAATEVFLEHGYRSARLNDVVARSFFCSFPGHAALMKGSITLKPRSRPHPPAAIGAAAASLGE